MNTTLKKLRKMLIKSLPTREEQIGKALRVIFHDKDEGLTDEEALKILEWKNYKSTDELFEEYDKDRITVNIYKENVVIFNDTAKELPSIKGIEVIQFIDELGIEE